MATAMANGSVGELRKVQFYPKHGPSGQLAGFGRMRAPVWVLEVTCRFGLKWTLRWSAATGEYSVQGQPYLAHKNGIWKPKELVQAEKVKFSAAELAAWLLRALGPQGARAARAELADAGAPELP
jgi:hypothetical protein